MPPSRKTGAIGSWVSVPSFSVARSMFEMLITRSRSGRPRSVSVSITVTPLHHDFVAEISGIDLARPLQPADRDAIAAAIDRYAVVVFHEQKGVS